MRPFITLDGYSESQLRLERGVTVPALAATIDYDRSALYQLERGTYTPGIPLIVALAKAFEVDELDFLVFPGTSARADVIDLTRDVPTAVLHAAHAQVAKAHSPKKKPAPKPSRPPARSRR